MTQSRRTFLKRIAAVGAMLAGADLAGFAAGIKAKPTGMETQPWFRRAFRWGQTNITEADPPRYDVKWWREYWKRTEVQGVIINAGGIVAYYPSAVPFHRRAQFLGDRDLFGESCRAAHEDGLAVFARMDSNRAHEEMFQAHPDWFARTANGQPYRADDLYTTCINSPYYEEHIPAIFREIVERYHPEGFTDNSWSGLGRNSICHCAHCQRRFRERSGKDLPRAKNWDDPVWREWLKWSYARRVEIWDYNNRVTRAAGGPQCVWVGMNGGSVTGQAQSLRDCKEICARAEILMLDDQRRDNASGFQRNGEVGKLMHGLLGWDKLMPESMALYQAGTPTFRVASKPAAEARLWIIEGIAGGIQPWWHHVGAYQEDRRAYHTAEPLMHWHKANQEFLVSRTPIATVGVVWSQDNTDFFGRDDAELLVDLPARGIMQALIRARIPYLPVHADHIERDSAQFRLLILPNLGAMSDVQVASVRKFVERGGGLLATGQSSLFNEWGDARPDFALADLFGAHLPQNHGARDEATRRRWATESAHSYLRLVPELRARMDGPHTGTEPPITSERHAVLRGFEETDILPFGGTLQPLTIDPQAKVQMTFVPSFPVYPPETSWMREPKTDIPGLLLREILIEPGFPLTPALSPSDGERVPEGRVRGSSSRIAYLPADLDRRFARDNLPDHGDLIANLVRWAAKDEVPLKVEGAGLVDCHLYRQSGRLILHLVNLTSAGTWRAPVDELISIGPLHVSVKLPADIRGRSVRSLASGKNPSASVRDGWCRMEIKAVLDHEVLLIG